MKKEAGFECEAQRLLFLCRDIGSRSGLHLLSPDWCTLFRVSYATLPRYCRNYALWVIYARRNRRNAPSMARFSLPCHPWHGISVCRVHNSTVSKQLRYSLMRESVPQPVSRDEAPYAVEGTEFVNSNYDDLKSVYTIWICMDTKKSEDSIIEFGMKSSLIYGKIKKIPQIDKLNGALINVRTRATKNKKQSKNKLIGMLE